MTPPVVRYPAGPITPHGGYYLKRNRRPTVTYSSPDGTALFNMLGGPAIPDRTMPECVTITDLKGLIPPWQNIKQKGATQDGSTYITSLYDECQVDITVRVKGRNPIYTRKVVRDWVASWDAKLPGELAFASLAPDGGYWWSDVRWAKPPVDQFTGGLGNTNVQKFTWSSIAYNAFWRSYANTAQFTWDDPTNRTAAGGIQWQFLERTNVGDQQMFDTYTCIGPGFFGFTDGPGSNNTVVFGPLVPNQIAQVRTDPRKRGVVPLTSTPASPQALAQWEFALNAFLDFATGNNAGPLEAAIASIFGAPTPQGNLYSLLRGRFSDNAGIPAKPSAGPAQPYHVAVSMSGGNANSMIIASGTPLRRYPL